MQPMLALFHTLLLLPYLVCALWPIPRSLTHGTSPLKLSPFFAIHLSLPNPPADILSAVSLTRSRLDTDTLRRLVIGRGATNSALISHAHELISLTLFLTPGSAVRSIAEEAVQSIGLKSESYTLEIPENSSGAILIANSTLGLLRGLTTFEQVWYDYNGTKYTLEVPITVEDEPAFAYRGFSFDTSRNFYPVSDILRTLDVMSWVKLNVLYWHVIDSQSFPLEVIAFPELSAKGAYSPDEVYTEADVQQIVAYANEAIIFVARLVLS